MKSLILAALLISAPITFIGCTSPQQTVYKATSATVQSVHLAMQGWMDYVVSEERRIAKLPAGERIDAKQQLLAKEGRVMTAYSEYQATLRTFREHITTSGEFSHPELVAVAKTVLSVVAANK